ncbi:unnamed protein product [Linum tenue]|uniref:Uncharacterized protein n=1 Tax=Linum tenue TaxID=586396 RepID=A0AAV0PGG3_9ROSI|nr:unnamed protein product [Linum tenue]
MEGWIEWT